MRPVQLFEKMQLVRGGGKKYMYCETYQDSEIKLNLLNQETLRKIELMKFTWCNLPLGQSFILEVVISFDPVVLWVVKAYFPGGEKRLRKIWAF